MNCSVLMQWDTLGFRKQETIDTANAINRPQKHRVEQKKLEQ